MAGFGRCATWLAALAGAASLLGGAASAGQSSSLGPLFMTPAKSQQVVVQALPLVQQRGRHDPLAQVALSQQLFAATPAVLSYAGYSTNAARRVDLGLQYYRQGLVLAPGPVPATEASGGLADMAAVRQMLDGLSRPCALGCLQALTPKLWVEQGATPTL